MGSDLVSIIIPVYNGERYIKKCIDSLINQTYTNIEIIVVNDGSLDKTQKIVKEYCLLDTRVKLYSHKNSGPSISRNLGIEKSRGRYLCFCDADDTVQLNYIEKLINEIKSDDYDIVTCGYNDISKYGELKLNDFYGDKKHNDKLGFINNIFKGVGGTVWGKIFKKDIIIKNNIKMNPKIYMCEDMIFLLEYVIHCKKYSSIQCNLYNYNRLNENSISSKINLYYYDNLIVVIEQIERILKVNNFDKDYIDKILINRIKQLSITFLIMQHDTIHGYSNKQKKENTKKILNNKYYIKYKTKFIGYTIKDTIIIFLMKKDKINCLNFYTLYLNKIQQIKDRIRNIL